MLKCKDKTIKSSYIQWEASTLTNSQKSLAKTIPAPSKLSPIGVNQEGDSEALKTT